MSYYFIFHKFLTTLITLIHPQLLDVEPPSLYPVHRLYGNTDRGGGCVIGIHSILHLPTGDRCKMSSAEGFWILSRSISQENMWNFLKKYQ